MSAERDHVRLAGPGPEVGVRLGAGGNGPGTDVFVAEQLEPARERSRCEDRRQVAGQALLILGVLAVDQVGSLDELAEPAEELGLHGGHRQVPGVRRLVRPVAGDPAGEHARQGVAPEAVGHELVRAMGHRDYDPRASPGRRSRDERGQDLGHRAERTGREVGDRQRGHRARRVLEDACPPEVVEVVPGPGPVAPRVAEPRERAPDDRRRRVSGPDPDRVEHAGSEPFDDDVRGGAERAGEVRLGAQVARDRLRAGTQRPIPGGGGDAHRVAPEGLDPHHARPEPRELPCRERAGQQAGEVDDQDAVERLRRFGHDPILTTLTDRSIAPADGERRGEDRRRLILDAAVLVFARDGYHTSRVGDIAEEAGVAHGLLYHYFPSKSEVLATLFRENWGELLQRFRDVEESQEPADEKLRGIAKILLRTWRNDPALVTVMVREVARSPHLQEQVDDVREGFASIQRVIEQGQAEGTFRSDLDARLASWVVYGALEEILTGWVLGQLPDGDEEVARAERTVVEVVCAGLAADRVAAA